MIQSNFRRRSGVLAGVLCLSAFGQTSVADSSAALEMAPHGANAAMTIDVAKLVQSPFGQALELQSKLQSGYADRPLPVPATARSITLVAGVHPVGLESIWQLAIVDLPGDTRIDVVLRSQGGYADTIEGKSAAWTKHDTYYVELDKQTLGVIRPGQRQFVSRWLADRSKKTLAPYLANAMAFASNADVVFALDMDGVTQVSGMRYALAIGNLPSLEELAGKNQAALLTALASVKGMTITMRATDKLNAEWVIDFGQDVSALGNKAEPFVIDVLTAANIYEGNADKWTFQAKGKQIIGKGTMDLDGLSRLIALLAPGDISTGETTLAKPAATDDANVQSADAQAAAASQKYYRAVAKSLDSLGAKVSPTQGAVWLSTQAKLLEQLPVLNVDPALLAWGNQVSDAYRRAGQDLAIGQQNAMNAAMRVASPTANTSYADDNDNSTSSNAETRAAFRNAQQQRRQAAQQQRVAAAERAFEYFNKIAPLRGQLRAEMSQKYGVEF